MLWAGRAPAVVEACGCPQLTAHVPIPQTDPVTIQDVRGRTVQNAVHVWSNIPAVKRYLCVHQGPGGLEAHRLGPITREPGRLRELCPGSLCGHLGAPHKFWTSSRAAGPLSTSGPSSPLSHWSFLSNSPLDKLLDVSHPACVP